MSTSRIAPVTLGALLVVALSSCAGVEAEAGPVGSSVGAGSSGTQAAPPPPPGLAIAIFATGCFWCSESDFEKAPGVREVHSGYAGGTVSNVRYEQVTAGNTGHAEAVRVVFDPKETSYERLLSWFWTHSDPFDGGGQFCDRGASYRPVIFPIDEGQRAAAQKSKAEIEIRLGRTLAVTIEDPGTFWVAEDYHQDFHRTNTLRYSSYRLGCGRDRRIEAARAELGLGEGSGDK